MSVIFKTEKHKFVLFFVFLFFMILILSCKSEDAVNSDEQKISHGPTSPVIIINDNDVSTDSLTVTIRLSAEDDVGVTGYYASESSLTPTAYAGGWISVPTTSDFSLEIDFKILDGAAIKDIYAWFKDAEGNVSNLRLQVRDSGNAFVHDSTRPIIGFNGVTSGTIDFQLPFDTTLEDDYSFEITIIDSQGFVSNVLTGSFSVIDPNAPATITFTPTSLTITDTGGTTIWDAASFTIIVRSASGVPLSNVALNITFPFVRLLDDGTVTDSPMQVTTDTNGTYVLNFEYQRGGSVAYVSDISVTSGTSSAVATFTVNSS